MEFALGAAYDQLKRPKDAIAAYKRAADLEPGDVHTMAALAQALLNDNQLDEALKEYQATGRGRPRGRRAPSSTSARFSAARASTKMRWPPLEGASRRIPTPSKPATTKALLLDVLGRYDEAPQVYEHMVDQTSHANGAYTAGREEQSQHLP